jgi:hypothetical protein
MAGSLRGEEIAPYGQQFPGLAPAQDQPLTEAGA